VRDLAEKVAKLRLRREDLVEELEASPASGALDVDHDALRATLSQLVHAGDRSTAKALMQQLVHEVRVDSREAIWPTFRVPTAPVRAVSDQVEVSGLEPPTSTLRTS